MDLKSDLGLSGERGISENIEEAFVLDILFDIIFLDSIDLCLRFISRQQAIHFGPETDKFEGSDRAGLALHFPHDSVVSF